MCPYMMILKCPSPHPVLDYGLTGLQVNVSIHGDTQEASRPNQQHV